MRGHDPRQVSRAKTRQGRGSPWSQGRPAKRIVEVDLDLTTVYSMVELIMEDETMQNVTTAQKISALLRDDGQVWKSVDGTSLHDLCGQAGGRKSSNDERGLERYAFADSSAITIAGGGWDLGYADCWCWQGVGHDETLQRKAGDAGSLNHEDARSSSRGRPWG